MRLVEFVEKGQLSGKKARRMPNGLQIGQVYAYTPKKVTAKNGKTIHVLTTYSFSEGHSGKRSYSIEPPRPILFKVLKYDHLEDDRVMRVRLMSDPEQIVKRFSIVRADYTRNDNDEIIERRLKNLPEFDNLDMYTDKEFYDKFGRVRLDEDHGLVGYIYVDTEMQDTSDEAARDTEPAAADPVSAAAPADGSSDKLSRAIQIYRAHRNKPRKLVIKLLMMSLDMTRAGASSYYTKAMHAVEEELDGIDDRSV